MGQFLSVSFNSIRGSVRPSVRLFGGPSVRKTVTLRLVGRTLDGEQRMSFITLYRTIYLHNFDVDGPESMPNWRNEVKTAVNPIVLNILTIEA